MQHSNNIKSATATLPCGRCAGSGFYFSEVACPRCLGAGVVDEGPADAPAPELSRPTQLRLGDVVHVALTGAGCQAADFYAARLAVWLMHAPADPVAAVVAMTGIGGDSARRLVERWAYAAEERARGLRAEHAYGRDQDRDRARDEADLLEAASVAVLQAHRRAA